VQTLWKPCIFRRCRASTKEGALASDADSQGGRSKFPFIPQQLLQNKWEFINSLFVSLSDLYGAIHMLSAGPARVGKRRRFFLSVDKFFWHAQYPDHVVINAGLALRFSAATSD